MTYDWQHPEVLDLLTKQMMTDLDDWRHERGRAPHAAAQDAADMLRAIIFAGEKLDAFQMARFLEDSRYWPADQQLVLKLQYAAKERDRIVSKLNTPPASARIADGSEIYIGATFQEFGGDLTVTAGPDGDGNWEVTCQKTSTVYKRVEPDLIKRLMKETAARAALQQPRAAPNPASIPFLVAPYVGLQFLNSNGDVIEVMSGPDANGEYVIKNHSNQIQRRVSPVAIMGAYNQVGPAPGHTVQGGAAQPPAPAPVPNVIVNVGLRFKDYLGEKWVVTGPSGPGRWVIEHNTTGRTETMSERNIQERYKKAGTWQ